MSRTKIDHADLGFNHRELVVPGLGFVGALLVCQGISFLYVYKASNLAVVNAKVKTIDNHVTTITSHNISVTELIATNEGLVSQLSEALGR